MINARNLAAILVSRGADVESALLALSAASPKLDAKVRRALFFHNDVPKLRRILDRNGLFYHYTECPVSRPVCVMHAVDLITQVIADQDVVKYLWKRFPNFTLESLCST